jgi:hypothetical protein
MPFFTCFCTHLHVRQIKQLVIQRFKLLVKYVDLEIRMCIHIYILLQTRSLRNLTLYLNANNEWLLWFSLLMINVYMVNTNSNIHEKSNFDEFFQFCVHLQLVQTFSTRWLALAHQL